MTAFSLELTKAPIWKRTLQSLYLSIFLCTHSPIHPSVHPSIYPPISHSASWKKYFFLLSIQAALSIRWSIQKYELPARLVQLWVHLAFRRTPTTHFKHQQLLSRYLWPWEPLQRQKACRSEQTKLGAERGNWKEGNWDRSFTWKRKTTCQRTPEEKRKVKNIHANPSTQALRHRQIHTSRACKHK